MTELNALSIEQEFKQNLIEKLSQFSFRSLLFVLDQLKNNDFKAFEVIRAAEPNSSIALLEEAIDKRKHNLSGFSTIENFSESDFHRLFYWLDQQILNDTVNSEIAFEILKAFREYYQLNFNIMHNLDAELKASPGMAFNVKQGAIPTLRGLEAQLLKTLSATRDRRSPTFFTQPALDIEDLLNKRLPQEINFPLLVKLNNARQFTFPDFDNFVKQQAQNDHQQLDLNTQRRKLKRFLFGIGEGDSVAINGVPVAKFKQAGYSQDKILDEVLSILTLENSQQEISSTVVSSEINENDKLKAALLETADLTMSGVKAFMEFAMQREGRGEGLLFSQAISGEGAINRAVEYNYFQMPDGAIGVESKTVLVLPNKFGAEDEAAYTLTFRFNIRDIQNSTSPAAIEIMPILLKMQPPLHRQHTPRSSVEAPQSPISIPLSSPMSYDMVSSESMSLASSPTPLSNGAQFEDISLEADEQSVAGSESMDSDSESYSSYSDSNSEYSGSDSDSDSDEDLQFEDQDIPRTLKP